MLKFRTGPRFGVWYWLLGVVLLMGVLAFRLVG
jgi:hypothetical protein